MSGILNFYRKVELDKKKAILKSELAGINDDWRFTINERELGKDMFRVEFQKLDALVGQKLTLYCDIDIINQRYNNDGIKQWFIGDCYDLAKKSLLNFRDPMRPGLKVKVEIINLNSDEYSKWIQAEKILNNHMEKYSESLDVDNKVRSDCKLTDLKFWLDEYNKESFVFNYENIRCVKWWWDQKTETENELKKLENESKHHELNFIKSTRKKLTNLYGDPKSQDKIKERMEKAVGLDQKHITAHQTLSQMEKHVNQVEELVALRELPIKYGFSYEKVQKAFVEHWTDNYSLEFEETFHITTINSEMNVEGSPGCPKNLDKFVEGCIALAEMRYYLDEGFRKDEGTTKLTFTFIHPAPGCKHSWKRDDLSEKAPAGKVIKEFNSKRKKEEQSDKPRIKKCSTQMMTEIFDVYKKNKKNLKKKGDDRDIWSSDSQSCVKFWRSYNSLSERNLKLLIPKLGLQNNKAQSFLSMLNKDRRLVQEYSLTTWAEKHKIQSGFDTNFLFGGANPTDGPMFGFAIGADMSGAYYKGNFGRARDPKYQMMWQVYDFNEATLGGGFSNFSPLGTLGYELSFVPQLKAMLNDKKQVFPFFFQFCFKFEYPVTITANAVDKLKFSYLHCGDDRCSPELGECNDCPNDCQNSKDPEDKDKCPIECGDGFCDILNRECDTCPQDCRDNKNPIYGKREKAKCPTLSPTSPPTFYPTPLPTLPPTSPPTFYPTPYPTPLPTLPPTPSQA
jgi:hypothetical protein